MRELRVTGLAQESDFDNDGAVQFLLVFNKGELRIPISAEAAQEIIRAMYANGHATSEATESTESEEPEDGPSSADEDGVDQV